ncbi:hypothetical protein ACVWZB_004739 [Paenibacillus polymyxa]
MDADKNLTLNQEMERARERLHDLYQQYGFGHACVLEQSMILDELINQYNCMYQTKRLHHYIESDPQSLCKTIILTT